MPRRKRYLLTRSQFKKCGDITSVLWTISVIILFGYRAITWKTNTPKQIRNIKIIFAIFFILWIIFATCFYYVVFGYR